MRELENQRFVGRPLVTENSNQPPLSWMDVGPMATGVPVCSIRALLGGISDDDIVSRLLTNGTSAPISFSLLHLFSKLVENYLGFLYRIFGLSGIVGKWYESSEATFIIYNIRQLWFQLEFSCMWKSFRLQKDKKGWASNKNYINYRYRVCLNFFEGICTHLLSAQLSYSARKQEFIHDQSKMSICSESLQYLTVLLWINSWDLISVGVWPPEILLSFWGILLQRL